MIKTFDEWPQLCKEILAWVLLNSDSYAGKKEMVDFFDQVGGRKSPNVVKIEQKMRNLPWS